MNRVKQGNFWERFFFVKRHLDEAVLKAMKMKTFFIMIIIGASLIILYEVKPSSRVEPNFTTWQRNLEEEKDAISRELKDLSVAIDVQLNDLDKKTRAADDRVTKILSSSRKRLLLEKAGIEKAMNDVKNSSANTWDDVKRDVKDRITDMKIEFSRVRERIKNEIDINS